MFVYPADEILFSRPSAWSLEEFQRIHSSRWGVLVSAIQANICPHLILHSASTKPPSVIYKRKVRTSESPGKEVNGFFYVIRHLPDETKGPFIDKLVKKTQDSWFLKSSVFALPIFWSRLSVSTAGQRGGYYVWKRGWGQTRLNDPLLNDEATELRSRWGLHAICFAFGHFSPAAQAGGWLLTQLYFGYVGERQQRCKKSWLIFAQGRPLFC